MTIQRNRRTLITTLLAAALAVALAAPTQVMLFAGASGGGTDTATSQAQSAVPIAATTPHLTEFDSAPYWRGVEVDVVFAGVPTDR